MSDVYFASVRTESESLLTKMERLFHAAGMDGLIDKDDLVAVKMHFGEEGNTGFLHPVYVRRAVALIKKAGGVPFLTDTNTLYKGCRSNAVTHIRTAIEHGFDYAVTGAPLIIADGLQSKDYEKVKIDGKYFKEVNIASGLIQADGLIALSHFKGHMLSGFGGTLKNIGMGFGSRSGKQMMHSNVLPEVAAGSCTSCGRCIRWCPADAIELVSAGGSKQVAKIDYEKCYGCGECRVTCPEGAIDISWEGSSAEVQEKIVEYVKGALNEKQGKTGFFNFLLNITPDCDCWGHSDAAIVPDIGILASTDPVALDTASLELVDAASSSENSALTGRKTNRKFNAIYTKVNERRQLEYAEKMGLGKMKYTLKEV